MVSADAFCTTQPSLFVFVKVCRYPGPAILIGGCFIIFTATTICSVGSNACGFMNTPATILMFVAMLSPFACTREPFKTKLIFCDFHFWTPSLLCYTYCSDYANTCQCQKERDSSPFLFYGNLLL